MCILFQPRSELISTYALCGFGSFPDLGICLGAIGAIVPSRQCKYNVALIMLLANWVNVHIGVCKPWKY